jgi:hypothetical protein
MFYDAFYRHYGVRLPQHLMSPIVASLDKFEFPRGSVYHFHNHDSSQHGPDVNDFYLREFAKSILMDHVVKLDSERGAPRMVSQAILPYVKEYHSKHRKYRYTKDMIQTPRDEGMLMIVNYNFLNKMYRYTRSMFAEYYKWWNTEFTVWKHVNDSAAVTKRQQFVFFNLPQILPSVGSLNTYTKDFNASLLKYFDTPESLVILELWKWMSLDHRNDSTMASILPENMSKVNLVFKEGSCWCMVNLGVLNEWRTLPDDVSNPGKKVNITPMEMQKRFLRMLMSLMSTRAIPVDPDDEQKQNEDEVLDSPEQLALNEETHREKAVRILENIDEDLHSLKVIEDRVITINEEAAVPAAKKTKLGNVSAEVFHKEETTDGAIIAICDRLADNGLLTASVYRNLVASAKSYEKIKSPDGKTTLGEFIKITPEDLKIGKSSSIPDKSTIIDKSMLKSSLLDFDSRYVKNILAKDVAAMVVNVQKAGVILSDYNVEKITDILGDSELHTIRVRPVEGVSATLKFRLPSVDEEGIVTYNNNRYTLRKQRGDVPIRKIAPDTVALTSYYGKTFVSRSNKKVNDYSEWLRQQIMSKGLDATDNSIIALGTADVFDNEFSCPKVYSTVAQAFKGFTAGKYVFSFDHTKRVELYGKAAIAQFEKDGLLLFATDGKETYLGVDNNNEIYECLGKNTKLLGSLEDVLGIDNQNAPVEFSEVKVGGKVISVGFILAYQLGLTSLLELLEVEPRKVPAGQRINLAKDEYSIVFSDVTYVFSKTDKLATMILAGLNEYSKPLRRYNVGTLDNPNIYLNILEFVGMSARYLREIDMFKNLFVDPITKDLLVEMNEPTTTQGLLVRSSELLLSDKHPDMMDMRFMRIKGYERLAGAVYAELVQAIRAHSGRPGKASKPLEMAPYAVWKRIVEDPSMSLVSDINPIENIKQTEAVTYSGTGGRGSRTMTKITRQYHESDMGVISESTKDSAAVGVNIYTSADPQFKSLRGTTNPYEPGVTGPSSLISSSALLAPGSSNDDPKRVNFVAIQNGHGLACDGYRQSSVRTGYEQVLPHRTGDLFATTAKQSGKVISKNKTGVVIEYADGSKKGIAIGRRFGNAAGLTIPHGVVCDLEEGAKFAEGDIIAYNNGFFERDFLNPKQVVWKVGVTVKTVLWESNQTLEDASSISQRLAKKLSTKITKVKNITVKFDQVIRNIVKAGDLVEPESILCTIEDAVTSNSNLFDEESLNTLKLLSNQTPTSKVRGVIDRVEVFYHGQIEDMSDSLKDICLAADKELSSRNKAVGKPAVNGSVTGDLRIDGTSLGLDCVAIRIYITSDVVAGVGDKGVFCNQMKTVFSRVLQGEIRTESGEIIDAVFGRKSINDRIVLSPDLIGTTNTLLYLAGKQAVKKYYER